MPTKIAKKLPKRVGNEKRKMRRANSWNNNAKTKDVRKAEQEKREKANAKVGCTGKMRYSNPKHANCTATENNHGRQALL